MIRPCQWCKDVKKLGKKSGLEWTVIDDDFGQYVHPDLIHFCFFCGRPLDEVGRKAEGGER